MPDLRACVPLAPEVSPPAWECERTGYEQTQSCGVEAAAPAYVAKIKRDDPFCPEDEREIEAMCRRIAAAGEFLVLAGWREDARFRVFHFPTWAKARAMQHWIDRSGIAGHECRSLARRLRSVRSADTKP